MYEITSSHMSTKYHRTIEISDRRAKISDEIALETGNLDS